MDRVERMKNQTAAALIRAGAVDAYIQRPSSSFSPTDEPASADDDQPKLIRIVLTDETRKDKNGDPTYRQLGWSHGDDPEPKNGDIVTYGARTWRVTEVVIKMFEGQAIAYKFVLTL